MLNKGYTHSSRSCRAQLRALILATIDIPTCIIMATETDWLSIPSANIVINQSWSYQMFCFEYVSVCAVRAIRWPISRLYLCLLKWDCKWIINIINHKYFKTHYYLESYPSTSWRWIVAILLSDKKPKPNTYLLLVVCGKTQPYVNAFRSTVNTFQCYQLAVTISGRPIKKAVLCI